MSTNKNCKVRQLRVQGLEKRELMAGDVGVSLFNGVLNIGGDNADNYVQVDQIADGQYRVRGLYSNGAATKINGGYAARTYAGVTDLNIHMAGGDDRLELNGNNIPNDNLKGDLGVQMAYGDDALVIKNFWVDGDANLATDYADNSWNAPYQGDDLLKATNFVVYGALDASTSEGADKIEFDATDDWWNAFHDGFRLNTGVGTKDADHVTMRRVFTWQGIDIDTSNGNDTFHGREVLAYEGDLAIDTHYGDDSVTLLDSYMDWNLTSYNTSVKINTGEGHDDVALQNVDVRGDVRVTTAGGHDDVFMHDVHARDQLYASLGSGNDNLTVKNSSADVAYLYGGSSSGDKLTEHADNFNLRIRTGWEWM